MRISLINFHFFNGFILKRNRNIARYFHTWQIFQQFFCYFLFSHKKRSCIKDNGIFFYRNKSVFFNDNYNLLKFNNFRLQLYINLLFFCRFLNRDFNFLPFKTLRRNNQNYRRLILKI